MMKLFMGSSLKQEIQIYYLVIVDENRMALLHNQSDCEGL